MSEQKPLKDVCPECEGRGTVLDAPGNALDGRAYFTPCPDCQGTGRAPAPSAGETDSTKPHGFEADLRNPGFCRCGFHRDNPRLHTPPAGETARVDPYEILRRYDAGEFKAGETERIYREALEEISRELPCSSPCPTQDAEPCETCGHVKRRATWCAGCLARTALRRSREGE